MSRREPNCIIAIQNESYIVAGPFPDFSSLVEWGQKWQRENGDDPRWQSLYLDDPHAKPVVIKADGSPPSSKPDSQTSVPFEVTVLTRDHAPPIKTTLTAANMAAALKVTMASLTDTEWSAFPSKGARQLVDGCEMVRTGDILRVILVPAGT